MCIIINEIHAKEEQCPLFLGVLVKVMATVK